ncbi:MAG: sel1 repeat family protein [Treponema sp.]|jgi:tetratricopeptide (TPR) repeat protein|nr:sel1 repeat family protein [Treponema sp.]
MNSTKFNRLDTAYSDTCCVYLVVTNNIGMMNCEKHHESMGLMNSPNKEFHDCKVYKQAHYCSIEVKKAEKEKADRERAEREKVAEEKRAREAKETAERLQKAAEQGDADAQYKLGIFYVDGQGVPKDKAMAVEWFKKAAEQGNTEAQYKLGLLYFQPNDVLQDYAKAVEWFTKAVAKGHVEAKKFLVKSWEQLGLCTFCGGEIKAGLFSTKCKSCGKKPPDGFA